MNSSVQFLFKFNSCRNIASNRKILPVCGPGVTSVFTPQFHVTLFLLHPAPQYSTCPPRGRCPRAFGVSACLSVGPRQGPSLFVGTCFCSCFLWVPSPLSYQGCFLVFSIHHHHFCLKSFSDFLLCLETKYKSVYSLYLSIYISNRSFVFFQLFWPFCVISSHLFYQKHSLCSFFAHLSGFSVF